MSESSAESTERLNIREQIARIDRNIAETQKLATEARKFDRDRLLAPILAAGALGGFFAAAIPVLLRAWGFH